MNDDLFDRVADALLLPFEQSAEHGTPIGYGHFVKTTRDEDGVPTTTVTTLALDGRPRYVHQVVGVDEALLR